MVRNIRVYLGLFGVLVFLASCAPAGYSSPKCGFFSGLLHGFMFLPVLIGKILGFDVGIYALNNDGFGYWVGYGVGFFCLGFGKRFLK